MKRERLSDTVELIEGDSLAVLATLPPGSVDAVITDPPYSSGGMFRGDRTSSTVSKYLRTNTEQYRTAPLANFGGDSRDQRSFFAWCSLWLSAASYATVPGGALCTFIDWRQLPVMTDAVQAGGWTWRNICTWWKPGVRMQRGRFSGSAEYLVYATNGANDSDGEKSPQNVFTCQPVSGEDKEHIAEKPVTVLEWAMSVTPAGSRILDPFAGSGAAADAAHRTGRSILLIERDPKYCQVIRDRVARYEGLGKGSFLALPAASDLFAEAVA